MKPLNKARWWFNRRDGKTMNKLETAVFQLVARIGNKLYALYDSAREPDLLPALKRHQIPHACLYDGVKSVTLAKVAPYLLGCEHFGRNPVDFIDMVWHRGVDMLIESDAPPDELKLQLKKIAIINNSAGVACYFRYYDARAFARFVRVCQQDQLAVLLGDTITAIYWHEAETDSLFCLRQQSQAHMDMQSITQRFSMQRIA